MSAPNSPPATPPASSNKTPQDHASEIGSKFWSKGKYAGIDRENNDLTLECSQRSVVGPAFDYYHAYLVPGDHDQPDHGPSLIGFRNILQRFGPRGRLLFVTGSSKSSCLKLFSNTIWSVGNAEVNTDLKPVRYTVGIVSDWHIHCDDDDSIFSLAWMARQNEVNTIVFDEGSFVGVGSVYLWRYAELLRRKYDRKVVLCLRPQGDGR